MLKIPESRTDLLRIAESMHPRTERVGAYYVSDDLRHYYVVFKNSNLPFYIGTDEMEENQNDY